MTWLEQFKERFEVLGRPACEVGKCRNGANYRCRECRRRFCVGCAEEHFEGPCEAAP